MHARRLSCLELGCRPRACRDRFVAYAAATSTASPPTQIADTRASAVENGHIKRITDGDIQSSVLEVASANVATTYITCPADPEKTLGIKLPFLVMIIKNLNRYFSFEVQVLDDKNVRRRFRASNYQVQSSAGQQLSGFAPERSQGRGMLLRKYCCDSIPCRACTLTLLGAAVWDQGEAIHLHHAPEA